MIIILNGSRNSGKSTIGALLAKHLPRAAHVEVDLLREFIRAVDMEISIPVNLENAVSVTENLVRKRFTVVLNYCLRKKDYAYLLRNLRRVEKKIYTVTLKPSLKIALSNRGRKLSADDKKRIREQYDENSPHHIPSIGLIVDNGIASPNGAVKIILNCIKVRSGRSV